MDRHVAVSESNRQHVELLAGQQHLESGSWGKDETVETFLARDESGYRIETANM